MLITQQRIIELCMTSKDGIMPFAVLVEQGDRCAWSIASGVTRSTNQRWNAHVLASKERRSDEWWVLDAWNEWLNNLSQESPESRWRALKSLERATPGIVVRKPRNVQTRLPVGAIASRWQRHRLFNRAEVIAAEIAHKLSRHGTAHWNASVAINGYESLDGDWIVEQKPGLGIDMNFDDRTSNIKNPNPHGLAIIKTVDFEQVEPTQSQWAVDKSILKDHFPYNVVIVRNERSIELSGLGCVIGERFPSAVSLGTAVVHSLWRTGCH